MTRDGNRQHLPIIGLAINLIIALITVVSGCGNMINPETSTIPAMLSMTFPAWFVATLAMAAVDLLLWRKLIAIPALAMLATLAQLLTISPVNLIKPKPSASDTTFTLLSYNTYGYKDYNPPAESVLRLPHSERDFNAERAQGYINHTAQVLLNNRPDICCLQEGNNLSAYNEHQLWKWQTDSIKALYPWSARTSGKEIWTIYPLRKIDLRQPDDESKHWTAALVNIEGHETLVVSVHLESLQLLAEDREIYHRITDGEHAGIKQIKQHLLSKLSRAFVERTRQAKLLRQQIDSLGIRNVIIAGDFNDIDGCYAMRALCRDDFRSAFAEAATGPTYTYRADRFFFNIDHVLYRGDMEAIRFRRLTEGRSDHYPVLITFRWMKQNNR